MLLLIIAETTQQALVGEDASVTGAFLLIVVLVGTDILLSLVKRWLPRVDRLLEGQPLVIFARRGSTPVAHAHRACLRRGHFERGTRDARHRPARGHRARVLERSGGISIVPRRGPES